MVNSPHNIDKNDQNQIVFLTDFTIEGESHFGGFLEGETYNFNISRYFFELINNPKYIDYFRNKEDNWYHTFYILKDFIDKNGKTPNQEQRLGKKLGSESNRAGGGQVDHRRFVLRFI